MVLIQPDRNCHEMSRVVEGTMNTWVYREEPWGTLQKNLRWKSHTRRSWNQEVAQNRHIFKSSPHSRLCREKKEIFSSIKKQLHISLSAAFFDATWHSPSILVNQSLCRWKCPCELGDSELFT